MGLGGGFILIIWLTIWENVAQKSAGGINLLFFLPIALISIILHSKNKLIEWKILPIICIGGALGVGLGLFLFKTLDDQLLQKAFAVLLLPVGLRELFHKKNV